MGNDYRRGIVEQIERGAQAASFQGESLPSISPKKKKKNLPGKPTAAAQIERKVVEGFALLLFSFSQPHSNYILVGKTGNDEEQEEEQKRGCSLLERNCALSCWVQGSLKCPRMWLKLGGGRRSSAQVCQKIHISTAHLSSSTQCYDSRSLMNTDSWENQEM